MAAKTAADWFLTNCLHNLTAPHTGTHASLSVGVRPFLTKERWLGNISRKKSIQLPDSGTVVTGAFANATGFRKVSRSCWQNLAENVA